MKKHPQDVALEALLNHRHAAHAARDNAEDFNCDVCRGLGKAAHDAGATIYKHIFRFPMAYLLRDMPGSCVSITYGEPGKVGSWFRGQRHAPKELPCGCMACILCGNLLMFDVRMKSWFTYKADWVGRS